MQPAECHSKYIENNMATSENITSSQYTPMFQKLELPATLQIPLWFTITFACINGGGFCLNALSLWLLATTRFVYRGKVNFFVVSLCFSDLTVSMSSFYFLTTITSQNISPFSKRVATIIFSFALETSLMSLCSLSYERLTAIRKPFRYQEILSGKRVAIMIIFGWSFCICLLAMQFLFGFIYRYERYVYFNWIVFIALSIVSIMFLAIVYVYLIYEIHRHSTHMKSCIIPVRIMRNSHNMINFSSGFDQISDTVISVDTENQSKMTYTKYAISQYIQRPEGSRNSVDKTRDESCQILHAVLVNSQACRISNEKRRLSTRDQLIKKERRSVLLCVCIVSAFAASWLPVAVFFIRCLVSHSCESDDQLLFICSCLVSLNSFLDPVLYFIIKREFRDILNGKMCRGAFRRGSGESKRGSSTIFL